MAKKNKKGKEESCRLLSEFQMEQLARFIIQGTGQVYHYGTENGKGLRRPAVP